MKTSFLQIYYYIAVFATILFVVKLAVFSFFGADSEVEADFNTETDTDPSFSFISVQSVLAFLMGFGWMGYAGLKQFGWSNLVSALVAICVGVLFMFISAYLMFSIKKLEKTVVKDKNTAVGKTGKAYTDFTPKGNGQIEINVNDQLVIQDAYNTTDEEIKAFDIVKVLKVEGEVMHIEKEF